MIDSVILAALKISNVLGCKTGVLRLCLVPHGMQNANYFGMMKCKMPKFLLGCLISSEMPIFLWGG
jgi:hypothetical protein